ncbi:unnamed protein product [Camellia sinensis]
MMIEVSLSFRFVPNKACGLLDYMEGLLFLRLATGKVWHFEVSSRFPSKLVLGKLCWNDITKPVVNCVVFVTWLHDCVDMCAMVKLCWRLKVCN